MEFKFRRSNLKILAGGLWLAVAILNFALMLFLSTLSYLMAFLPLVTGFLAITLGFYHLDPFGRNYIVIDDSGLFVHQGMFRKQKRIFFNSIEAIMETGKQIRLQEGNGKETEIMLDSLELRGIKEVRRILLEKCKDQVIH